uniref:Uncharacterized protein n=1 Tax=Octopus bimaculoides TaxID=37653 RepID=A0A0L8IE83_OCTBM
MRCRSRLSAYFLFSNITTADPHQIVSYGSKTTNKVFQYFKCLKKQLIGILYSF